jgi:hypothetical protein
MLLVAALLLSLGAPPADAARAGKPGLRVSILTGSQQELLRSGLKVRVVSRTAGRTVLRGSGRSRGLFRTRSVRFSRKGQKVVRIQLSKRGRDVLSKCGNLSATVLATTRYRGRSARSSKSRSLRRLTTGCFVRVPVGSNPARCDFLDTSECLYPFANDYYTRPDSSTETGKRLDISPETTPINIQEQRIDVTDINRGDGFSPGNMIVLKIPGLDTPAAFENNNLVPITDTGSYTDPAASVVVIDADTGERHPIWAELDSNPTTVDPVKDGDPGGINTDPGNTDEVNLIVRPARNFEYGHRYIVAFRNLKNAGNRPIPAPLGFRVYRDRLKTTQPVVERRRSHMNSVIADAVSKGGLARGSLYMAWDFTVASRKSLTGRALQIRDDAFARLGDSNLADRLVTGDSPDFEILAVCDKDIPPSEGCRGGPNPPSNDSRPTPGTDVQRVIEGRLLNVPCYLDENGCDPGATFDLKANGDIDFNPAYTMNVPFRCFIPESIQPGGEGNPVIPGDAGIYGHGLLGDYKQITSAGPVNVGRDGRGVWCGANWDGFSSSDLLTVVNSLKDMSNFNQAVDRMQQGFVNFMLIGRAMIHEDGFSSDPAFQLDEEAGPGDDLKSAIDLSQGASTRVQYMGISQGGIMGGALMALTPDADYGVLGVPGMNYSALLRRSVDSDSYFKNSAFGLYTYYPNYRERPLILSLVQLLWDRGEANGYAEAMTDKPLPNTPPHAVLLRVAFGDHQVANITAETEARTIGASMYSPALNAGRHWEAEPFSGMDLATSFPFDSGSMMVYYDSGPPEFFGTSGQGIATPPNENVPPRKEWGYGGDPHEHPRRSPDGVRHAVTFLDDGTIESCEITTASPGDAHCYANGWTGPAGP